VNIADVVRALGFLFSGQPDPSCLSTSDVNDDGAIDISDPIALLGYLFGSSSLPAPGESCGIDPTPDSITCLSYDACP